MKKLLVALVLVLSITTTGMAYAWWDSLQVDVAESNIITIGQGMNLVVATAVIDPLTDGNLIPASAELKTGDTYQIDIDYEVSLNYAESLSLAVSVTNILIDGVADTNTYIIVAVTNPGTVSDTPITVTLSVTIDDAPVDEAAALATLANAVISFDVQFLAS